MYSIVYSRQFYYQFTPHIKFKRSLLNTNQVGLQETLIQKPHILLSLTNSIVLRLTSRLLYTSPLTLRLQFSSLYSTSSVALSLFKSPDVASCSIPFAFIQNLYRLNYILTLPLFSLLCLSSHPFYCHPPPLSTSLFCVSKLLAFISVSRVLSHYKLHSILFHTAFS